MGGGGVLRGTVLLGTLVGFMQYAQRFFRPIQDLSEKYNILQAAMAASERVFKLLDTPPVLSRPPNPSPATAPAASSSATSGSPTSPSTQRPRAHCCSERSRPAGDGGDRMGDARRLLHRRPGETAAIVGHTGAGKTTIISLMMRFYDVQHGQVLVDGVDVRDQDLTALRRRFGVVLQDPFLFTGTVADNIRLGTECITDETCGRPPNRSIWTTSSAPCPRHIDEPLRERGARLSTGQKQLINFARALAHAPAILILDEAT